MKTALIALSLLAATTTFAQSMKDYRRIEDSIKVADAKYADSVVSAEFKAGTITAKDTAAVRKSVVAAQKATRERRIDAAVGIQEIGLGHKQPKPSPFVDPRNGTEADTREM